jgi:hypothetical protein
MRVAGRFCGIGLGLSGVTVRPRNPWRGKVRPNSFFSVARTTDRQSHAQASRLGPLIEPEGTRSNIQQRKGPYLFGKSAQNKAIAHKRDLQALLIFSVTPRDKTSGFSTP